MPYVLDGILLSLACKSIDNISYLQVKDEAQQLAQIFETVGAFKVKRKGGKGKQIFGRLVNLVLY